jgi:hypothetical protein
VTSNYFIVGVWCAMSATRVIQAFSLSEALSTHGYVKHFLTPFLNTVPIMRKERLLKKNNAATHTVLNCPLYLPRAKFLDQNKKYIIIEKRIILSDRLHCGKQSF